MLEQFSATAAEAWMPSNVRAMLNQDPATNPSAWSRIEATRRRGTDDATPWLLEGELRAFTAQGTVIAQFHYKDNQTNGLARVYYPDGKLQSEATYINGSPEGQSRGWHPNGKPHFEFNWKNRQNVGLSRFYHESGQPSSETHHDDAGLQQGWSIHWWPSGREMSRTFNKDNRALITVEFDESGAVHSVSFPVNEGNLVAQRPRSDKERLLFFHADEDYELPIQLPKPTVE